MPFMPEALHCSLLLQCCMCVLGWQYVWGRESLASHIHTHTPHTQSSGVKCVVMSPLRKAGLRLHKRRSPSQTCTHSLSCCGTQAPTQTHRHADLNMNFLPTLMYSASITLFVTVVKHYSRFSGSMESNFLSFDSDAFSTLPTITTVAANAYICRSIKNCEKCPSQIVVQRACFIHPSLTVT